MRGTLLKRGHSTKLVEFKNEFSEAQVMYSEFQDMVEDFKLFVKPGESMEGIERVTDQVEREWKNFDCDIRSEIIYLEFVEQHPDDSCSEASKVLSRASRKSHKSKISSISDLKMKGFSYRRRKLF